MMKFIGSLLAAAAFLAACSERPSAPPAGIDAEEHARFEASSAAEPETVEAGSGARYRDKAGFSIEFPSGWEHRAAYAGTNVISLRPPGELGERFRENVNVVVEMLPRGVDLEAYLRVSVANLAHLLNDVRLIEDERTEVAGRRAARLVYSASMGQLELQNLLYVVFDGDRALNVTCSMVPETFSEYRPVMETIVSTLRLE